MERKIENETVEKYKVMERDAVTDAAEAGELGVETIIKTVGDAVVGAYKVIEEDVVEGYQKVEDAFVEKFLTHNETAEAPAIENEAVEKYKVMERDAITDAAEAGELGVETIIKTVGDAVVGAYKVIEEDVVGTYKKVEEGFVGAYKKAEDTFVEKLFAREGESAEDAKKRLQGK